MIKKLSTNNATLIGIFLIKIATKILYLFKYFTIKLKLLSTLISPKKSNNFITFIQPPKPKQNKN